MPTTKQKVDAAVAALADLQRRYPTLAQQLVTDWTKAHYSYSAKVAADVFMIGAVSLSDSSALRDALSDPAAAAQLHHSSPSLWSDIGTGVGALGKAAGKVADTIASPLKTAESAAVTTGQFLSALTNPHTWVRVAEVGIGIALLIVGVIKLTPKSVIRGSESIAKVAASL